MTNQPAPTSKSQRNPWRLLLRPKTQMAYAAYVFFTITCAVIVYALYLKSSFARVTDQLASGCANTESIELLRNMVATTLISTLACGVAMALMLVAASVAFSHRVFGPMIPLLRQIEALKAGRYSARVKLRDTDEFHDVMDALNELAVTLEKKS